jgi:thimet oligopeptidase
MDLGNDLDAESFRAFARERLAESRAAHAAFLALPPAAAGRQVLGAYDAIRRPLDLVRGRAHLASQVHPAEPVRQAGVEIVQELSAFETDLSLDRPTYERLAAIRSEALAAEEERRLLAHTLRDYRRSGVDRDDAVRARIKQISEELVRTGQAFDMNIARDTRRVSFEDGAAALAGLPADYVAAHAVDASGCVTVSTDPSDFVPFMSYARRGDLRRRLYLEYTNRAAPDNLAVLGRLLELRHELAQLLGYACWADYVTEDKMIKSGAAAREFVARVAALARPRMLAEVAELLEEKRREEPDAQVLHDWERGYWTERFKARALGFDSQSVRPYFAYANVRDGVLATSAALYGVEFRRDRARAVWHHSVECYEVVDGERVVARLYLDMHPRPNKYKHAAMFDLRAGLEGEALPEAALVCNFSEPRGDDPALLLHQDVTTFFHEFGHLLHHLFAGRQRYLSFSGIATEWDFVEAPSQMYEEWAWDAGVLARFARHHATREPIPAELVARLRAAEEYGKGTHVSVQMFYAALSLALHDRDPVGLDPMALLVELKGRTLPFPHEPGSRFLAAFGHLHGYSAIYYTYMWSLVIAKDLFSRFDGDLMNNAVANDYRREILAPGGSRDAAELVRGFLGRDYATDAWEAWLNR